MPIIMTYSSVYNNSFLGYNHYVAWFNYSKKQDSIGYRFKKMGIISKIFLAILIYLFAEIYVFIEVSSEIGFFNSVILLVFFGIIGYFITKKVKSLSFNNAMSDYMEGRSPSRNIVKSISYFISGVLFLVPGFITDLIAVLFLIPFLNIGLVYLIFRYIKNKFQTSYHSYYNDMGGNGSGVSGEGFTFISLPFKKHRNNK